MILIDWFYPRCCFGCEKDLSHSTNKCLCYRCWEALKIISKGICYRCGRSMGIISSDRCFECRLKKFAFKQLRCVGSYEDLLKQLLLAFKFSHHTHLTFLLGELMTRQLQRFPFPEKIDFALPVPLHIFKLWERGYNQSALIASYISKKIGCDYLDNILYKCKNTPSQSTLALPEREQNLKEAFAIAKPRIIENKNILLVDDIYTSGNTINECCAVLKRVGKVRNIYVAVIAKGKS